MTDIHDLVLVHYEDRPLVYARVEDIQPDVKPGWYHITLLLLQIPAQPVTWILRDAYINGTPFTMNGKTMRLEPVASPASSPESARAETPDAKTPQAESKPKVISFADLKKGDKRP